MKTENIKHFVRPVDGPFLIFYHSDVDNAIPSGAIEISQQEWLSALDMSANHFDILSRTFSQVDARTDSEKAADQRAWFEKELKRTDKYMMSDYPMSQEEREEMISYRQGLREGLKN